MPTESAAYSVIDERLMRDAVQEALEAEHKNDDPVHVKRMEERVELNELTTLVLSFKRIAQINHLGGLNALTTLKLDNNCINKIENLEHLVSLKWLDLSFNSIQKIEGIDKLANITDLSLYNNEIQVVEGISSLKKLQVLSLGNNKIKGLEFATLLRKMNSVKVINFEGNPVCEDTEYKSYLISHVPHLAFLDFKAISDAERETACETHQDQLIELEESEAVEKSAAESRANLEAVLAKLRHANIEGIETLFDDMFADDADFAQLQLLPSSGELLDDYREKLKKLVEQEKASTLQKHARFMSESDEFNATLRNVRTVAQREGADAVRGLWRKHKHASRELRGVKDVNARAQRADALQSCLEELHELEMEAENVRGDRCGALINQYDTEYHQYCTEINTSMSAFFDNIREVEDQFIETITTLKTEMQEKYAVYSAGKESGSEAAASIDDELLANLDLQAVLQDKETLNSAVTSSHDNHVALIDKVEDDIRERNQAGKQQRVDMLLAEEKRLNYERVVELQTLRKLYGEQLEILRQPDEDEYE